MKTKNKKEAVQKAKVSKRKAENKVKELSLFFVLFFDQKFKYFGLFI